MLIYQPDVLKARREELGLRLEQVAATAKISLRQLCYLERGSCPRADTLGRLATALRTRPDAFYLELPDPERQRQRPLQTSAHMGGHD